VLLVAFLFWRDKANESHLEALGFDEHDSDQNTVTFQTQNQNRCRLYGNSVQFNFARSEYWILASPYFGTNEGWTLAN
jgi:hypothetical protein